LKLCFKRKQLVALCTLHRESEMLLCLPLRQTDMSRVRAFSRLVRSEPGARRQEEPRPAQVRAVLSVAPDGRWAEATNRRPLQSVAISEGKKKSLHLGS